MRPRSPRRFLVGAALGLSLLGRSAPAAADWISLASSTPLEPGQADPWWWLLGSMASLAGLTPQIIAGVEIRQGKQMLTRKAGVGLFVPGALIGAGATVGLGFVDADDNATVLTMLGGPMWSMAGVGLGHIVGTHPHAPWLGGSMGFTTFATMHGVMTLGGLAGTPTTAVFQSIYAGIGGTGCFIDAAYSRGGVERGVAIGCGVVASLSFLHGVVKVMSRSVSGRPPPKPKAKRRRALMPYPMISEAGGGVAIAGTF